MLRPKRKILRKKGKIRSQQAHRDYQKETNGKIIYTNHHLFGRGFFKKGE